MAAMASLALGVESWLAPLPSLLEILASNFNKIFLKVFNFFFFNSKTSVYLVNSSMLNLNIYNSFN